MSKCTCIYSDPEEMEAWEIDPKHTPKICKTKMLNLINWLNASGMELETEDFVCRKCDHLSKCHRK